MNNYLKWNFNHIFPEKKEDYFINYIKYKIQNDFLNLGFYKDFVVPTFQYGSNKNIIKIIDIPEFEKVKNCFFIKFNAFNQSFNDDFMEMFPEIPFEITFERQTDEEDLMILESLLPGISEKRKINKLEYFESVDGIDLFENDLMELFEKLKKKLDD